MQGFRKSNPPHPTQAHIHQQTLFMKKLLEKVLYETKGQDQEKHSKTESRYESKLKRKAKESPGC